MLKRTNIRDWSITLFFLISVFSIYHIAAKHHFNASNISPQIFREILEDNKNVVLIDLRESREILREPFSSPKPLMHLPFLWLRRSNALPTVTPGQITILLCSDGNRSRLISTLLAEQGMHTFYLEEGLWSLPATK